VEKFGLEPYIRSIAAVYEKALAGADSRASPLDGSRLEVTR
jgi:hypothetical protein